MTSAPFSWIAEAHRPQLFRICMRILRDRQAAEDCVQTSLAKAFEHLDQFRADAPLPAAFATVEAIAPNAQLAMQAALQPFVDNAISKTINVAADVGVEEFAGLYRQAWEAGLKGCTVFRPNRITGEILSGPEPRCERCDAPARTGG